MENHVVTDYHAGIDSYSGVEYAILTDFAVVADIDMLVDNRPVSNLCAVADIGKCSYINSLPEFGGPVPASEEAAVPSRLTFLVGNVVEELGYCGICVLYADKGDIGLLFRNEILVHDYYGSL
jgi:hypothetical protein